MSQNTPSGIRKTTNGIRRLCEIAECNQDQDQDRKIDPIDRKGEIEH